MCGLDCTMSQENMRGPLVPVTTAPWRRAERRSGSRRVLWHTRDWEITLVHKYLPFRYVSQGLCSTYFLLLWKYFTVILKWCFYELYFQNVNIVYCFHCAIRSTADLESFHNHILMYASKRFSFSPPVHAARISLAGLDYNHHIHRPAKREDDGSIQYVVL